MNPTDKQSDSGTEFEARSECGDRPNHVLISIQTADDELEAHTPDGEKISQSRSSGSVTRPLYESPDSFVLALGRLEPQITKIRDMCDIVLVSELLPSDDANYRDVFEERIAEKGMKIDVHEELQKDRRYTVIRASFESLCVQAERLNYGLEINVARQRKKKFLRRKRKYVRRLFLYPPDNDSLNFKRNRYLRMIKF